MSQSEQPSTNVLDTFDHVVVLMLENRSFDNLLGYLYSQEYPVPPGKKFEGVDGKNLSNPIPHDWHFMKDGKRVTDVPVARMDRDKDLTRNSPPYPDPGEDYPHVNTQLFNSKDPQPVNQPPYNLPSPVPLPTMDGFVTDYILNYFHTEVHGLGLMAADQFSNVYKYVVESYDPADIPVVSRLAREFAVFDHWFCSVPSETICNRNFWHSGTSWGHVINPGPTDDKGDIDNGPNTESWLLDTVGDTLFSRLSLSHIDWKIYSDNHIALSETETLSFPVTPLLHFFSFVVLSLIDPPNIFKNMLNTLQAFKNDCASGTLPAYSFIEPNFFNPHNDMHPSTPDERVDGSQKTGSVVLGELLVWEIYNAIFTSPHHWDNTLLIITFDEHGGCYDHVRPPGRYGDNTVEPADIATPPHLFFDRKWDDFDFDRLGLRIPMIMVSPFIAKNTIINEPMSHTSFLQTMRHKWWWLSIPFSARDHASPGFHDSGVFSTTLQRKDISQMPVIPRPVIPPDGTEYSDNAPMSPLAKRVMSLFAELWRKAFPEQPPPPIKTQADAAVFLRRAVATAKSKRGQLVALDARINESDWVPLFQVLVDELKDRHRR